MRALEELVASNRWMETHAVGTGLGGVLFADNKNIRVSKLGLFHQTHSEQVMAPSQHGSNALLSNLPISFLDHVLDIENWNQNVLEVVKQ